MAPKRQSARLLKLGEFQLIQSIPDQFCKQGFRAIVGAGDDAAVLPATHDRHVVISTDLLVEGIHFSRKTATFYDIGYKAAAANLSDMAAMGATPTGIFVAIALPLTLTSSDWQKFYRGLAEPCKPYQVKLLGGDTSSSLTSLFIGITVTGQIHPEHILTRNGAKVGDLIYVSGTLGDAAAGLAYLKKRSQPGRTSKLSTRIKYLVQRHLRPTARIVLGQLLASRPFASAAMDLSDGLSGDLNHLCGQSQVGALIDETKIPISQHMRNYAKQIRMTALHWSLHGGEDYELLFTISPKFQVELEEKAKKQGLAISKIGVIQPKRFGIRIENSNHIQQMLIPQSYEHFS